MAHQKVDIVFTVLNGLDLTKCLVDSIRKYTDNYRLIIVDGGSTDGTVEWLRDQDDIVSVINDAHVSYSEGINQGLELVEAPYFALFNNDVEVDEGWLGPLVEALERHPEIGAIGALSTARQAHWEGYYRDRAGVEIISYQLCPDCALFRREVYDKIGGFDEGFDSYGTDNDYAVRMRRAGWEQAVHCGVIVRHEGGATLGRAEALRAAARQRLREKWPGEGF